MCAGWSVNLSFLCYEQGAHNSENMEISGNLLILEILENLNYTQGIFVYQMLFFAMQSETHNKPTCKFIVVPM